MSTGDDTIYLRSRIAERRGKPDYGGPGGQWSSPPQFMKDGFQKWAESTRPAREGGSEKIGCERQMPPRKGAGAIEDAVALVGKMKDLYDKAKDYTPMVKKTLRDPELQQKIAKGKYAPVMEKIAKYMEMVGLGHLREDKALVKRVGGSKSFKQWAAEEEHEHSDDEEAHGGRIGMGHHKGETIEQHIEKCLKGGMSASEALDSLKKYGKQVYEWLKTNKAATKAILESPYLNEKNPLGPTDLPRQVKGYMEKVGLGATPKKLRWNPKKTKGVFGEDLGGLEEYEGAGRMVGGRKPSAYAMFVKEFARKHPGPDLMRRAGAAWKGR